MESLKIIVLSGGSKLGLSHQVLAILRSTYPGGSMTKTAVRVNTILLASSLLVMGLTACAPQSANREIASVNDAEKSGIINGEEVAADSKLNTSIVAIYNSVTTELCTGSLLPGNIVLTAAHCIGSTPESMFVLFDTNLSSKSERRQVLKTKVHPLWQYQIDKGRAPVVGDIALILFNGSVPEKYKPAKMLGDLRELKDSAEVVIAGFGMFDGVKKDGSGTLRQATIKIAKADYNQIEVKLDQRNGQGACHGDSGGPAYIFNNGEYLLWGITSRGSEDPNDECSQYSIYTNAVVFVPWMISVVKEFYGVPETPAKPEAPKAPTAPVTKVAKAN